MKEFLRYVVQAVVTIVLTFWFVSYFSLLSFYLTNRDIFIKMKNGQTFGIPKGWHLVVDEDTNRMYLEENKGGMMYENN